MQKDKEKEIRGRDMNVERVNWGNEEINRKEGNNEKMEDRRN